MSPPLSRARALAAAARRAFGTDAPPPDAWRPVSIDRSGLAGGGASAGGGGEGGRAALPPGWTETPLLKHLEALINVRGLEGVGERGR